MRVSRGLNASNVVEIVTRLVFLFLHSGEGKKCFHCSAKIILRNCWRLLGDTEQILADDSFHPPNLPTGKRAVAARKRSRSDRRGNDHHTLGRLAWSAPTQPTQVRSKHFRKASRTITLVIKIDDEGKAARARARPPRRATWHSALSQVRRRPTSCARYARAARRSSRT